MRLDPVHLVVAYIVAKGLKLQLLSILQVLINTAYHYLVRFRLMSIVQIQWFLVVFRLVFAKQNVNLTMDILRSTSFLNGQSMI